MCSGVSMFACRPAGSGRRSCAGETKDHGRMAPGLELALLAGHRRRSRTLMTSLEGVWRIAVTPAELETLPLLSSRE